MLLVMSALATTVPSERASEICKGGIDEVWSTCYRHAYTEIANAQVTAYVESLKQEFMEAKLKAMVKIVVNGISHLLNATMLE